MKDADAAREQRTADKQQLVELPHQSVELYIVVDADGDVVHRSTDPITACRFFRRYMENPAQPPPKWKLLEIQLDEVARDELSAEDTKRFA